MSRQSQYSAAPSFLGYFYQCRYALLETLRRLPEDDTISIGIETLDDVVFQTGDSAVDVLQTKLHINAPANLTDASSDLWKTLRIWIEGQSDGTIPQDARFFLVTTAVCGDGAAAAYLRPGNNRDEQKALQRLAATASTSTNTTNAPAYQAFSSLNNERRRRLMKSITVLDGSPLFDQLDSHLRQAIFYAVERRFLDSYLQRLEGWWYGRVVGHLRDDKATSIRGEEIESEASRIREQLKEDALPIDDDIMQAAIDAAGYSEEMFVRQLGLIDIQNPNRVMRAIKNYYRAFEQRSRWMREELLHVGELDRYDDRLFEDWDILFQIMRDKLGDETSDKERIRAGQDIYEWVETKNHHAIRPTVTESAIARGTYQMLADDLRVGWHPEFRDRLGVPSEEAENNQ
uniref:ABC-three component systems C-terminal domain-containing protein n=1 Tax=Candidatus Kentrum sp. UNK TaxID=2126344 RepID=A0A451AWY9_9GAMM|nr:MAG: hypothetical protein BECKUNK1418G_GA0071005_10255 [Candidatus Kentron sp. UNK]VFK70548.1 MAG: hypothetical protein BECKUNK1418H_GA0071006_103123 [Candidatus Kentron sp. UNK]